jgi:5-(carboxyamino)imidazole ribonucleotide mutase
VSRPDFVSARRGQEGCVVIVAGSDSDKSHIEKLAAALKQYEIPCEVRICSAHKSPGRLLELIREYEGGEGDLVYVAVAGGTDALSGTLAFHSDHPVLSCPPDGMNKSCLTNPPGSSNATILEPRNVARFVAQMFSARAPRLRGMLRDGRDEKIRRLEQKDAEFRNSL